MPRRTDLKKILLVGSGPIVIGQACEFDYSGTQGAKALKQEGYEVVLVNSNPATIMTDPEFADRTYVEPLTPEILEAIIVREKPDALLPTLGGQTALNLALALHDSGALERHGVELLGANVAAIRKAEDRELFKQAMEKLGLGVCKARTVKTLEQADEAVKEIGFPIILRPSFTMGGTGGGIAYNKEEFDAAIRWAFSQSPTHECLVEESVLGWKEFELEVIRDPADNFIVVCSIENFDPMGVHTGDSITVAPAMTLTDKEYQILRDAAKRIISEIGVETEIIQVPQDQFITKALFGDPEFYMYGWRNHGGSFIDQQYFWWHSSAAPPDGELALNFGRVRDPIVDENLEKQRTETDPAKRKEYAENVNRQMAAECYSFAGSWTIWGTPYAPKVQGIGTHTFPDGTASRDGAGFSGQFWTNNIWIDSEA